MGENVILLQYKRAVHVLKECMEINPCEPLVPLFAAKLCFEHLYKVGQSIYMCISFAF